MGGFSWKFARITDISASAQKIIVFWGICQIVLKVNYGRNRRKFKFCLSTSFLD